MGKLKKTTLFILSVVTLFFIATSPTVFSHCEIPCGIYNDSMRLDMMAEHITTIEKSMTKINELSAQSEKNFNQLIRWTVNKEEHADYLSEITTQYFMTQRIKPVEKSDAQAYEQYVHKLTILHNIIVYSMHCKQTTDLENVTTLRALLAEFRLAYMGPAESTQHEHSHEQTAG